MVIYFVVHYVHRPKEFLSIIIRATSHNSRSIRHESCDTLICGKVARGGRGGMHSVIYISVVEKRDPHLTNAINHMRLGK